MHYDFKMKLNKVDSQQYKNFLIPEIDWLLNEAQEIFVKIVAEPRKRSYLGFEKTQRTIDDIRTIVITDKIVPIEKSIALLPTDYWHFLKANVRMTKGGCKNINARLKLRQHDDEFENSPFDNSSFEWRTVNGVFNKDGIKFYTDGTFTNTDVELSYIKKLKYIHNAKDFRSGKYKLPSGILLDKFCNCELPNQTHREIVDLAVLIVTGQIYIPDYQIKLNKLNLNDLK